MDREERMPISSFSFVRSSTARQCPQPAGRGWCRVRQTCAPGEQSSPCRARRACHNYPNSRAEAPSASRYYSRAALGRPPAIASRLVFRTETPTPTHPDQRAGSRFHSRRVPSAFANCRRSRRSTTSPLPLSTSVPLESARESISSASQQSPAALGWHLGLLHDPRFAGYTAAWSPALPCLLLLFPNPAAAGQPPQLFHGIDHGTTGHVAGNFHLADFAGQHKVHHAILRFLVGLQPRQDLARVDVHFRQASQAQNGVGDSSCGYAVSATHTERNVGCGDHSP